MCTLQLFGFLPLPPFLFGRGEVSDVTKRFKLAYFSQDTKPLERGGFTHTLPMNHGTNTVRSTRPVVSHIF